MTLAEQVHAQAMMLIGQAEPEQEQLLRIFCRSAVAGIVNRLREGLMPEDCKADLVASGALFALAALEETDRTANLERLQLGDVTMVRGGTSAASRCLRRQAELIISPYCRDDFVFRGV